MKRIIKGALFNINGLLFYEDRLFSGIAYELLDEQVVRPLLVKNGVVEGPHFSPHVDDREGLAHVDLSEALSDYCLPEYQGQAFTGIAYSFLGDYCAREVRLENGDPVLDTWWDKDGTLIGYERYVSGLGEVYEWYRSGVLKSCRINTSDSYSGYLTFTEDGRLQRLGSRRGFLLNLPEISGKTPYFPFSALPQVLASKGALDISLLGTDVNDTLIESMHAAGLFADTASIELIGTEITSAGLAVLQQCAMLKKIVFQKVSDEREQLLRAVIGDNPALRVEFK